MSVGSQPSSLRSNDPASWEFVRDAHGGTRIALPVVENQANREYVTRSRNSRRRAIVLGVVQLVLIAHIVQWLIWGRTITPIEPSESMEFSKHGIVNAGLIFFVLALLSTLILGRWFCGWGCHVVLLQDACGWVMKRCGIRPRPFRSRLLLYVPLLIALYMFILPVVHRWGLIPLDRSLAESLGAEHWLVASIRWSSGFLGFPLPVALGDWKVSGHLTTTGFWDTFAGPWVAIPFLLICGFATVYFLGAKGFCTYGCPYGGFFAPLDRYSPARIRVTDACEGCGHCTAVCTSNVRVHEEVRDYGMVVDPGCMKCMDCVSVCPKDALYFGLGRPAIGAPKRTKRETPRSYDLSWPEEIGCAVVFAGTIWAVRGAYGLVPMLMAVGVAICITFIAWKTWRLARDQAVELHRFVLKRDDRVRLSGWVWVAAAVLATGLVIQAGLVRYHIWRAVDIEARMEGADPHEQRLALAHIEKADAIVHGGIGLLPSPDALFAKARLSLALGESIQAEQAMARALEIVKPTDMTSRDYGRILVLNDKHEQAVSYYEQTLAAHPEFNRTRETLVHLLTLLGRSAQAQQWRDESTVVDH